MKIKNISDRLIYIPDRVNGQSEFRGECSYSSEAYALLKEEGIDYIRNKISQVIDWKKEIYGFGHIGYYGLHSNQKFFDLKNRIGIEVKEIIEEGTRELTDHDTLFMQEYPQRDFEISLDHIFYKDYLRGSNIQTYQRLASGRSSKSSLKKSPYTI